MIVDSPLDLIFRKIFYRLRGFSAGHDVFLKLEGFNVTGSIKVKTAIGLIEDLEQRGVATPRQNVIIESSSGNLGIALSMVCASKGYQFICVTDSNATRANIRGMQSYGAKVIVVEDREPGGGFLEKRFEIIDQLLKANPKAIWLNQYDNPANVKVHAEQTANEIADEFQQVDWIFLGAGTTGTLGGICQRLRDVYPHIKIVAVEPKGSVTFGGRPGKRYIPGIGTSVRPAIADFADPDRIVAVNELTTVRTCLSFAQDYHLLVGGSTGTVLAAIKATSAEFAPGETVVAISPDMGDKYLDTIYNAEWVEKYISASAAAMSES